MGLAMALHSTAVRLAVHPSLVFSGFGSAPSRERASLTSGRDDECCRRHLGLVDHSIQGDTRGERLYPEWETNGYWLG